MTGISPRRTTKRVCSLLMALVMITSVFAGGALAQESPSEADIADEVYVTEEGDAVLVYEDESSDTATGEVGLDVSEGLVYALVTDDIEEDLTGSFELWADPSSINGSSEITTERPEGLDEFSMDASGTYTDEEASFDASLEMAIDASEEPMAMYLDEATTQGTVESSLDRFSSTGEYALTTNFPQEGPTERTDVTVKGTDGDYTLEVRDKRTLTSGDRERWETEAAAERTLEGQFAAIAAEFGGEATVTIQDHSVETEAYEDPVLDVEYTVDYEGLDQVAQQFADELAADSDLSQAESEALVDAALGVEFDSIDVSHAQSTTGIEGSWDVDVRNMAPIAESTVDLVETGDDGELADRGLIEDLRGQLEAQRESELTQTTEWEAELKPKPTDPQTMTLTASLTGETENWATYVDELEERGIGQQFNLSFDVHGETVGDEIELELAAEMNQDEFLTTALTALTQELEADPNVDEDGVEFWQAIDEAGFEVAGIDVDAADGTMTVTAGAKFESFAAFEEILEDEFHGLSVTHAYSEATGETETDYLYVDGLVDADPTEDDVRETEHAGDETEIHLNASLEDHPRLDYDAASEFLGVDVEGPRNETGNETATDSDEDDGMPGFGVAGAVAVLLSIALLRVRD